MNDSDRHICPDTLALPVSGSTAVPIDMEALDIKPELLDLSENKQCYCKATKACQTEITLCDEFWNVCTSSAAVICFFFGLLIVKFVTYL